MSFGYKTAWFAVRSSNADAVIRALRLTNPVPAEAQAAITLAYDDGSSDLSGKVFVTPPLGGWTLATSTGFLAVADAQPSQLTDLVARISAELATEVQFFATHRIVEAHLWARAINGQISRAHLYVGESGETQMDVGEPTPEEVALGLNLRDPNEEDVMSVAGKWSVNPSLLDDIPDGWLADLAKPSPPALDAIERPRPSRKPWWQFW